MAVLNIRGFPDELQKELKVRAVKEGKSLKELVIEILEKSENERVKKEGEG